MQRGGDRVALHRYGSSGPMVLVLPAMGVDASYYAPFAEALAVEGTRSETTAGGPIDHIKWVRRPRALARQIATFAASG